MTHAAEHRGSSVSLTTDEAALEIATAYTWSKDWGGAAVVTYAFRSTAPAEMPEGVGGFERFNAQQIRAAEFALLAWSDVANITFQRVGGGAGENAYSNEATILFSNYTSGRNVSGFATLPPYWEDIDVESAPQYEAGDVWIDATVPYNVSPVMGGPGIGGFGYQTLLHEIGHAIGLDHPGDYASWDNEEISYEENAAYREDSDQYTVMGYWEETYTGASFGEFYVAAPMLHDIAAVQLMYGANMTTRTGNTVYGFNSNTGRPWYTATGPDSALICAVWDAGGTDTFDFSGYADDQLIDLRPGQFSHVGGLVGNVAVAAGVQIENGIGGSGADSITGNHVANHLRGRAGDDQLNGGLGDDSLEGGAGNDILRGGVGVDTAVYLSALEGVTADLAVASYLGQQTGGAGIDHFSSIERIVGSQYKDTLSGDDYANGLVGMGGADTLQGREGDDLLDGAAGADALDGGAGFDTAVYFFDGAVTVNLASGVHAGVAAGDTFASIEAFTLSAFADQFVGSGALDWADGNAGADLLYGGGGDDVLDGGAGADRFYGGAGMDTARYREAAVTLNRQTGGHTGEAGGDRFTSVERFLLSDFADRFTGNAADETVYGYAGDDVLNGGGGRDFLAGGLGNDRLRGGDGADTLTGGAGADTFVFRALANSTAAAWDRITDLAAVDILDLSAIDANGAAPGNGAFTRVHNDGAFSAAGQLRLLLEGAVTRLELNTDADGEAEMVVILTGNHTAGSAEDGWIL